MAASPVPLFRRRLISPSIISPRKSASWDTVGQPTQEIGPFQSFRQNSPQRTPSSSALRSSTYRTSADVLSILLDTYAPSEASGIVVLLHTPAKPVGLLVSLDRYGRFSRIRNLHSSLLLPSLSTVRLTPSIHACSPRFASCQESVLEHEDEGGESSLSLAIKVGTFYTLCPFDPTTMGLMYANHASSSRNKAD
ncbi:hypothetical protein VFPPC_06589 [Pochonia chlamydosporia 170]|uniref:Uncharacterized protein n=1 Tax=Pochonia chlamydosporia 170 TaxID=1380566 RepID=A0A179F5Q5_METCM|nr:hypothetical protein VFPPC_06589 [Pochonia chlamydosporia 170]OAQ60449.1 hypothetical protein VFPPC_06589 [Pochonia chlamydosporia 170]